MTTSDSSQNSALNRISVTTIAARLERLPMTAYQRMLFLIIATAWFFDSNRSRLPHLRARLDQVGIRTVRSADRAAVEHEFRRNVSRCRDCRHRRGSLRPDARVPGEHDLLGRV